MVPMEVACLVTWATWEGKEYPNTRTHSIFRVRFKLYLNLFTCALGPLQR